VHLVGFIVRKFVTMHGHMSIKKRLLSLSCPSVCPHVTAELPLDGFSQNLILEDLSENLWRGTANVVPIGHKYRVVLYT
jgi:hypothetical protein